LKQPLWDNALNKTKNPSDTKFELSLSRPRAAKFAALGKPDVEGRHALFSQAFRAIHTRPIMDLRRHGNIYNTTFVGEFSHDAGGPYRESFAQYCAELQSDKLGLFSLCPNGRLSVGLNRDCWVPKPSARSQTALEMFAFLGKLMGVAIRNQEYLNLKLPSFVWRQLANDRVTRADLLGVDLFGVNLLDKMADIDKDGVTEETFDDVIVDQAFTAVGIDGTEAEVAASGRSRLVTWHNRMQYVKAVEHFRLHEIDQQCAAIRAGLATVVPQKLLCLYDWTELERMVCGRATFDVDLLKAGTVVEGISDSVMDMFWAALREMSSEEASLFLRFVWGRSRLPIKVSGFKQKFRIKPFSRSPADRFLPEAHTCFFQLDLPAYSSKAVMKEKLTYAAYNCMAIDADDTSTARRSAEAGWEA
jgi:hypothetical protein